VAKPAKYQPISAFWTIVLPALIFGLLYFAYNSTGWVSFRVQKMLDPIVQPVMSWARSLI